MRRMPRSRLLSGLLVGILLGACTAGSPSGPPAPEAAPWVYTPEKAREIADQSCPGSEPAGFAMSVLLNVQPVDLGKAADKAKALDGLIFRGGWSLDTSLASFGGLSGLDILPGGDLLAVSDAGALVHLPFDQAALEPQTQATLTYLKDQDGDMLTGKAEGDAEGLQLRDGIAFVSFERNHRIEAYGYERCGGNARAVRIASMDPRPAGLDRGISQNSGAEALAMVDDSLLVGLETLVGGQGPLGRVTEDGGVSFSAKDWINAEGTPLVGADEAEGRLYTLHRAYNPLTRQNTIAIRVREGGESRTLAFMRAPLTLDNFEAVAVWPLETGEHRIFILSDNNFSDNQRTLLYVFETEGLS